MMDLRRFVMVPRQTAMPLLLALGTGLLAACDGTPSEALVPVLEERTSFESGLGSWQLRADPEAADAGGIAQGNAADGSAYLELRPASGAVWIERSLQLTAGRRYNVTVGVQGRAFSGSGSLVKQVARDTVRTSDLAPTGSLGSGWARVLTPIPVTADGQGRIRVAVGVSSAAGGTFGLDAVEVIVLAADAAGGS
jgi:hypothetical protein